MCTSPCDKERKKKVEIQREKELKLLNSIAEIEKFLGEPCRINLHAKNE